jgi:hypothetical protein
MKWKKNAIVKSFFLASSNGQHARLGMARKPRRSFLGIGWVYLRHGHEEVGK